MDQAPIPLLDLRAQYDTIRDAVEPAIREVVESQWFIGGPRLEALEQSVAELCGTTHAVGCASGSDALLLSLMAVGVGPGDEVICPSFTFFATAGSIWRLGARPVWVDIDPATFNCTADGIRQAAARCTRLKAIMPVHLFGQALDMTSILEVASELGVPVLEDAAQAIGALDETGAPTGSRGTTGSFSFFPSKNLGGFGDGGMITTNDDQLAEHMRRLRNHGMEPKYYHREVGLNSRLDAIQAAVIHVKLPYLDEWSRGRQENADDYDRMFREAGAVDTTMSMDQAELPVLVPARPASPARHVFNQYSIQVPANMRDDLRARFNECGIGHDVYYPVPLHRQDCFAGLPSDSDLSSTDLAASRCIALPIYTELTSDQRARVAGTVIDFVRTRTPALA